MLEIEEVTPVEKMIHAAAMVLGSDVKKMPAGSKSADLLGALLAMLPGKEEKDMFQLVGNSLWQNYSEVCEDAEVVDVCVAEALAYEGAEFLQRAMQKAVIGKPALGKLQIEITQIMILRLERKLANKKR